MRGTVYALRYAFSRTERTGNQRHLGFALDVTPRQRLLQLVNLSLGEVGVTSEIQPC